MNHFQEGLHVRKYHHPSVSKESPNRWYVEVDATNLAKSLALSKKAKGPYKKNDARVESLHAPLSRKQAKWQGSSHIQPNLNLSMAQSHLSVIHYPDLSKMANSPASQSRSIRLPSLPSSRQSEVDGTNGGQTRYTNLSLNVALPDLQQRAGLSTFTKESDIIHSSDNHVADYGAKFVSAPTSLQMERQEITSLVQSTLYEDKIVSLLLENNIPTALPRSVAVQSPVLSHLLKCSGSFKEGETGVISLPTIAYVVFEEIVAFLYYIYAQNVLLYNMDTFKPYQAHVEEELLSIMEASLYLDLPALVDICAKQLGARFDGNTSAFNLKNVMTLKTSQKIAIESLAFVPAPLTRVLLTHVSIGNLVHAEHLILPCSSQEEHQYFTETQTDSENALAPTQPKRITIPNLTSVWIHKFWKVLSMPLTQNLSSWWDGIYHRIGSTETKISIAKSVCLEFYVTELLSRAFFSDLKHVFAYEGHRLAKLSFVLTTSVGSLVDWNHMLSQCPSLQSMDIMIEDAYEHSLSLSHIMKAVKNRSFKVVLKLITLGLAVDHVESLKSCFILQNNDQEVDILSDVRRAKYLHMKNESQMDIKGISSLQEYMTLPSDEERAQNHFSNSKQRSVISEMLGHPQLNLVVMKPQPDQTYLKPDTLIALCLNSMAKYGLSLTKLNLSGFSLGRSLGITLGRVLREQTTSLRDLDVADTHLGAEGVIAIVESLSGNETIKRLNLGSNILADDPRETEAAKTIGSSLSHNEHRLEYLNLSDNSFSLIGKIALIDSLPLNVSLRSIVFDRLHLGTHAKALIDKLCHQQSVTQINDISLRRNGIVPRTIQAMIQTFLHTSPHKNIVSLDLSENHLNDECIHLLAEYLTIPSSLKVLKLDYSDVEAFPPVSIPAWKTLLNANTSSSCKLETLSLSCHQIDDSCIPSITNIITSSSALKSLHLQKNLISDSGLNTLLKTLGPHRRNKTFSLDLRQNWISPELVVKVQSRLFVEKTYFINIADSRIKS